MWKEFKKFAVRGNMLDLAVGVIIGGAFNSLVSSLVDNVIMPILSLVVGRLVFSNWFIALDGIIMIHWHRRRQPERQP